MELIQSFTPEAFAGYSALGAALIIPTVELIRAHVLKSLQGAWVVLLSVGVGAAYGALGGVAGYVEGGVRCGDRVRRVGGVIGIGRKQVPRQADAPKSRGLTERATPPASPGTVRAAHARNRAR
jgi:hypothetical protein